MSKDDLTLQKCGSGILAGENYMRGVCKRIWVSCVMCHCVVSGDLVLYDLGFIRRMSNSLRPCELWPRRLCYLLVSALVLLGLGLVMCRVVLALIVVRWRVAMRLFG